ncbi:MAG: B12-binding domain-containing radical SAM protein [Nitrospina sp.]|nr:B12-binding domain-containing radical SAM protein [Nitrospina sp.]
MGIKVLFIYPNTFGMNMLPPAISLFSAILRKQGHEVALFDATYYAIDYGVDSDGIKAERLNVVPFDLGARGIKMRTTDWREDLDSQINSFCPDLIALSTTEDMWNLGLKMLTQVKDYISQNNIPVLAGGVFPTFAPEIVIQESIIDMVCVGEGENALVDLCEKIEKGQSYEDVTNLWIKQKNGSIKKNPISNPVDVDEAPILDMSLFEEQRLYRPMAGKWYKMMPVETIRGCPYKCTFCNSPDQITMYKENNGSNFFRKKSISLVYNELKHFKEDLGVEYNYFWADTFLAWSPDEFEEFCEMYKDIGLPFWMQTRPETVSDYKIKKLADVGLHRISFGIEHGNEGFRKKLLERHWKNKDIIEALKIPHRHGVQFSLNNITGFPTETRELAMDTVELNRNIDSDNQNLYSYVPFHGTPLRKLCEDTGLVAPETITKALTDKPMLIMPQYPQHEIEGLIKCFTLYVKFPKNRWKEIKKAEADTPEGSKIYEELKQEYIEKYLPKTNNDLEESSAAADLEYGVEQTEVC